MIDFTKSCILTFFLPALCLVSFTSFGQIDVDFTSTENTNCFGSPCNYDGPSILINEIMMSPNSNDGSLWGGTASQAGEWIELYNPDICEPVDISCFYLGNNAFDGSDYPGGYVIPPGTVVPAAGFALIRGVNAPPVPNGLLVENGGNVVELVVDGDGVCVGGGNRLWFPNAGGWFAFYDSNGEPQDAVSWANQSNTGNLPCVPTLPGCSLGGSLPNYDDFPNDRKTYILNVSAADFQGESLRRIPDGGAWSGPDASTMGACNSVCAEPDNFSCNGTATAEPDGGVPPYTYLWDDPQEQTTQTAIKLCAGVFCVEITDAVGTTTQQCITIEDASYTTDISDDICDGESYTLPDNSVVTTAGEYVFPYQTANGCDSLVTVELEVFPEYAFTVDAEICDNQTYTLPDGSVVEDSGTYVSSFQSVNGCDSTYTVNLDVLPPIDVPVSVSICPGDTYELPDGTEVDEAGEYSVLIPGGATACDTLITVDVDEYPSIDVGINEFSHISCAGEVDGVFSLNISGAPGPYSFTWSDGVAHGDSATGLAAGAYQVDIVDANGCEASVSATISEPQPVSITASADTLICVNSELELTAEATGGTGDFTYHWSHNTSTDPTATATPDQDTTYTVFATDENGCGTDTVEIDVTVISMSADSLQTSAGAPTCAGDETFVEASYSGAYGPYSYSWSNGLPSGPGPHTVSPTETTEYTVTVSDACGNEISAQDTTVVWALPVAEVDTSTDVTCFGNSDGTVLVDVTDGTPDYSFTWSDGVDHGSNATGLGPDTYDVQITDVNGCETSVSATISEPQPVSITASADTLICVSTELSLSAEAIGGTGDFTYHWSHNSSTDPTTTATPDQDTTYTVFATDENGCGTDTIELDVTMISMDVDSLETLAGDPICAGDETFVEASYSGAYGPYSYSWSNGLPDDPGPHTVSPTETSEYTVTVSDACGNEVSAQDTAVVWALPVATVGTSTNVTCFGNNDGTVLIDVTDGTPDYSFTWSDGADHGNNATGLSSGTYAVEVSDANGCETSVTARVREPQPVSISALVDTLTCFGTELNFSAEASGGTGDFTYHWSHTTSTNAITTATPSQDSTYTVFATDENECGTDTIELDVTVISMQTDSLQASAGDPICVGDETFIEASYSGTYGPYSYSWSNGLPDGPGPHSVSPAETTEYTVTVSDSCGNEVSAVLTTTVHPLPVAEVSASADITCFGSSDGTAIIEVSEGTPDYSFAWSDGGDHGSNATGLGPDTYDVQITDANGCETDVSFSIDEPKPLVLSATADTLICIGSESELIGDANGGIGPYTYHWNHTNSNDPSTTVSPNDDSAYTLYAEDANGCTTDEIDLNVSVISMSPGLLSVSADTAICAGDSAELFASYSGNYPPYTFEWSGGVGNGPGTHTVTPNTTTTYKLTVSDFCDNTLTNQVTVNVNDLPEVTLPNLLLNGCSPFETVLFDSIQTSPGFTHEWVISNYGSVFGNPAELELTEPGIYEAQLIITSPEGCLAISENSFPIEVFPLPEANFSASPWTTDISEPEVVFTNTSEGYTSSLWRLEGGEYQNQQDISFAFPDTGHFPVELVVENEFGCRDSITQWVTIEIEHEIIIPNGFTPGENGDDPYYDPGSTSNTVFYPFSEYVAEMEMSIFNRWGELIFNSDEIQKGWNGTYRDKPCPQDVYVYKIEFEFTDGKKITKVGDITLFR